MPGPVRELLWKVVCAASGGLLLACVLAPLWRSVPGALVDYPTHAARAYVLSRPPGSPELAFYQPDWIPVPNLGVDILLSGLMRALPPVPASALFLTLAVLVLVGGAAAWSRALGGGWEAALMPAVALGDTWYRMGFANFVLGTGMAAWAMAGWAKGRGSPLRARAVRLAPWLAATAVVHLMAALVLAALAAADEFAQRPASGRTDRRALLAVPAGLLLFALLLAALGKTVWNGEAKILALQGLARWFGPDTPILAALASIPAMLLLAGGSLGKRPAAAAAYVLAVAAALGPSFAGGTAFSSERLTLPLMVVLAAHCRPALRDTAALLGCAGVAAAAQLPADLRRADRVATMLGLVRQHVGPGDTLVTFEQGLPLRPTTARWHLHAADWAVFDGVFVPQLFAKRLQQPLKFTARAQPFKEFQGQEPLLRQPTAEDVREVSRLQSGLGRGDAYLLVFGLPGATLAGVERVGVSADPPLALYRVRR